MPHLFILMTMMMIILTVMVIIINNFGLVLKTVSFVSLNFRKLYRNAF